MTPTDFGAIVDRALALDGWMRDTDLRLLAEWAASCRRVAEIGVYQGRTTLALALAMPADGRLFAVDNWRGEPTESGLAGDALRCRFEQHLQPLIETGRVAPLEMHSLDAAMLMSAAEPLDLVFIDAAHDYDSVRADVEAWLPLVRPGGVLAGHDFWQPDVRRALDDVLGEGRWEESTIHVWRYEVPG